MGKSVVVPVLVVANIVVYSFAIFVATLYLRKRYRFLYYESLIVPSYGLKSDTFTFNHVGDFKLLQNQNALTYNRRGPKANFYKYKTPKNVKFISIKADGVKVMAMDENRQIWSMISMSEWASSDIYLYKESCSHKWSSNFYTLPVLRNITPYGVTLPECTAWSVSQCGQFVYFYTDASGTVYKNAAGIIPIGTSTLYALINNEIRLYDPWLRNIYSISTPEQDTYDNMDSSGSTIFLIKMSPLKIYTRYYDMSLVLFNLKIEDWYKQPNMNLTGLGKIFSDQLTIVQTGRGNSERELRVKGSNFEGRMGYYRKMIFDSEWSFAIV